MLENKNNTLDFTISAARKSIKNRFPELNDTDIQSVIEESIESYKKYKNQHPDLKIKVSIFLIFYATIKIENNLSKQELMLILKENENTFSTGNGIQRKSFRVKESEERKQKIQYFNNIKNNIWKKLSLYISISDCTLEKKITALSNNHPELSFENMLVLIIDTMGQKINKNGLEYTIVEYCKKFGTDFFEVMDIYINLYISDQESNKESNLLYAISKVISSQKKELVCMANLFNELGINKPTFHDKHLKLSKKFPNIPNEVLLKAICDYYYIKKYDNKLLELLPKIRTPYRDNLILEIVLLRMEQVLTYEEAYYMASKNFEEGTSLLHSKYGDSAEEKTQNIYSKK